MSRAIWKGSIAFGLVNIPVGLTAAESKPDIQLHMVDSKNHARIRYERVNADTGEEVPWDRLVKGYEYEDGQFVLLTDADLEAVQPKLTKTIEISEFVNLDDIDPMLFDKPYYLEPEKRGRKAYALLREALRTSGKAGISRVVIRTREYLAAIFVRDEVLILMLLRFPQEIRSAAQLDLPTAGSADGKPVARELELATKLIDEMTTPWRPEDFHDEYREALNAYIEKKIARGESVDDVVQPDKDRDEEAAGGGKVLDLAEYLERSFKQAAQAKAAGAAAEPAAKTNRTRAKKHVSKKVPAKKAAAKKGRRSA